MNRYMITTDAQDFEVILSANFNVLSYGFNTNNETLQFNIETSLEERNIGQIDVPRDLIDGEITVLLDGKEISHKLSESRETYVISVTFDGKGKHTLDITKSKNLESTSDAP